MTTGDRIMITGCSGSGKSTLAGELQRRTGLPLYHLDNIWWKADRTHITRGEFDAKLAEILRSDRWIIDGMYSRTCEMRLCACDTVIFLDYSEEDCMRGITERVGRKRSDIPWAECSLDPGLAELVMQYRTKDRPVLYHLMGHYPDKKLFIFRNRAQTESWLCGENPVMIQEITPECLSPFWDEHIRYLTDDGIISDPEDTEYFSGSEYRGIIKEHMLRDTDRHHTVYFLYDGQRVGAASYCTYLSEDGKCFILDFWVFPNFRGNNMGHRCFYALEEITRSEGAAYYELNSTKADSIRFWKSLGFTENGKDEYDMPLFIRR